MRKRRRAAAVQDAGALARTLANAKRPGVRQPSGAGAQNNSCQPVSASQIPQAVVLCDFLFVLVNRRSAVPKRRRAAAVQDAGALARTLANAKRPGVRQPSGAGAQNNSCQPVSASQIPQAVVLCDFLFVLVNRRSAVPKRRRAAAVQDAGALARTLANAKRPGVRHWTLDKQRST